MEMEDVLGENTGIIVLQMLIVVLAGIIIALLFMERSNTNKLGLKIDSIEPPSCPSCPDCTCDGKACPTCPDCNCPDSDSGGCPACPQCPDVTTSCPELKTLTPEDIADAIFPGRNKGITSHGKYFPLDGLGEGLVEPAFSPVVNLMPNYVGGDGVPGAISFKDQTLLSNSIASQKMGPMSTTQGVFTETTNDVVKDSLTAAAPTLSE